MAQIKSSTNLLITLAILTACSGVSPESENVVILKNELQNGDIVFHISKSEQSKAIQLATNSKYSHMGIVYNLNNELVVYEAVQPVKFTPLDDWIKRGENGHYVAKRLKNADSILTPDILNKMKGIGEAYLNKDYDIYFEWSDERIYCSELVWKIYQEATGIEIGQLGQLRDFDLTHETVKKKMRERYGKEAPMEEQVISPAEMFNSTLLVTVIEN
ncbi:MAG: peptidoglycan peptidase [Flavobacteriales bacterium]|nr:MAG: peptidoglycan peptidase [Flavobacteriales bacterium]